MTMKTRNILYIVTLGLTALSLSSCNKFLDVMPDNRTELDNPEKIRKLLVSAYPARSHVIFSEFSSDNCDDLGKNNPHNVLFVEQCSNWDQMTYGETDDNKQTWQHYYAAINYANTALEAIEELGSPAELLPSRGEALMCRAYAHFCLATLYCLPYHPEKSADYLGIPYMEKPETKISSKYSRGNLKTVYEKINRDIEEALRLIKDDVYSVPKYHFNRAAAYAFAARFNLYYMNWPKTVEYASVVLGSNPALSLRNWAAVNDLESQGSTRQRDYVNVTHKFNLMMISLTGLTPTFFSTGYSIGSRFAHNNRVSKTETYRTKRPMGGPFDKSNNDSSGNVYQLVPNVWNSNDRNKIYMPKWSVEWEVSDPVTGAGGYRSVFVPFTTNETLMCRAEAYIHLKEYDKAVADLEIWNQSFYKVGKNGIVSLTRERINDVYGNPLSTAYIDEYTADAPTSRKRLNPHGFGVESGEQENMLQCLLYCRRIETLIDGLRWGDIKRYGIAIHRFDDSNYKDETTTGFEVVGTLDEKDLRRAIQLPQEVISVGLEANPRNEDAPGHPFRQ